MLFCSRGRGRGHAVRDLEIVRELRNKSEHIEIIFASYDSGFAMLQSAGENVVDLMLPERNPFPETVVKIGTLLRSLSPHLVVAQEEFAAITAARLLEVAAVFTSHWFPYPNSMFSNALLEAARVLFMEEPGLFPEPPEIRGKVTYCGPIIRSIPTEFPNTAQLRQKLGVTVSDRLILVLPGSPPEEREPIVDLVRQAFSIAGSPTISMLWVAGADFDLISKQFSNLSRVHVIRESDRIPELIHASDLVITKATYNIAREVLAIGRRAISLSHGYNWVDDAFSQRWANNTFIRAKEVKPDELSDLIKAQLALTSKPERQLPSPGSAGRVAEALLEEGAKVINRTS